MAKKQAKEFIQNDISKRFIEAAKYLVDNNLAVNYREISEKIDWTEVSISSVRAGRINVPM